MRAWILGAALLAAAPAAAEMAWWQATQRLQDEKGAAVRCARAWKAVLPEGDARAETEARLAYDAARDPMTAVIAGLSTALDEGAEEDALAALEANLADARAERVAFCQGAKAAVEAEDAGEGARSLPLIDAALGLADTLVEAGVTVWLEIREVGDVRRANLKTALEDARWPEFPEI